MKRAWFVLVCLCLGCRKPAPPLTADPDIPVLNETVSSRLASVVRNQDDPSKPPETPIELEFKAEPKQIGDHWSFVFSGKTNMLDGTVFRLSVYYPGEYVGREGTTIIPDYLVFHQEEDKITVAKGTIALELYRLHKRPFSLKYIARVVFERGDQEDKKVLKALDKQFGELRNFERTADITVLDNKEAFEQERREAAMSMVEDFRVVRRLYNDVRKQFEAHRQHFDSESWLKFKNDFMKQVVKLRTKNLDRFTLFRCWTERKGRFNLEHFVGEEAKESISPDKPNGMLEDLVQACEAVLKDSKKLEEVNEQMHDFEVFVEDKYEELDLDLPNGAVVMPMLAELEKAAKAIPESLSDWDKKRDELRKRVRAVILRLATEGSKASKKIHIYTVQVSTDFTQLFDAVDGGKREDIDQATQKLKESIEAFKSFVGGP